MAPVHAFPHAAHAPPLELLLVDDDPTDVFFAALLLHEQPHPYTVTSVTSGDAALTHLAQCRALPDLILLDLQMDGMDGFEVLARLKAHPQWRAIPVIILSATTDPDTVLRAYQAFANGYLVKHSRLALMRDQLSALLNFWRFTVLPHRPLGPGGAHPLQR